MTRFLELMFYVSYLRIKKNGDGFLVASTLLGLCITGFLFLTAVLFLVGVVFDIKIITFMTYRPDIGTPLFFLGPIVTVVFFYNLSVKNNRYLSYGEKYPEVKPENLDEYDKRYMLSPAVFSLVLFFISIYLTFELGRGV
jgi:hypothetical protein